MERVFVVPRKDFFGGRWPHGLMRVDGAPKARALLDRFAGGGFFAERPIAEENPAWKQTIPYCVVTRGAAVLCVERTRRQGERRLHDKLSIGLGGHVNPIDGNRTGGHRPRAGEEFFLDALARELAEELVLPSALARTARFVGLLNDDSTAVGRVHCGLVYRLEVPAHVAPESVRIRETSKMSGGFRGLVDDPGLWQDLARFETWSGVLLRSFFLDKGARATQPPA